MMLSKKKLAFVHRQRNAEKHFTIMCENSTTKKNQQKITKN